VIASLRFLLLLGPWMLNQLLAYTADLWGGIRTWSIAERGVDLVLQQFAAERRRLHLVLCAGLALFRAAPLFSSRLIPARVRGIAAVALAIGCRRSSSAAITCRRRPKTSSGWPAGTAHRLAFAFVIGALFSRPTVAGSFLDTMIGFSYGSLVDPLTGTQSSVSSRPTPFFAVLIFIANRRRRVDVRGPRADLRRRPAAPPPGRRLARTPASTSPSSPSHVGDEVAGPVVLASCSPDAAFGLVSRVVPQLNVLASASRAKVAVGLLAHRRLAAVAAAGWPTASMGAIGDRHAHDQGGLMAGEKTEAPTPRNSRRRAEGPGRQVGRPQRAVVLLVV